MAKSSNALVRDAHRLSVAPMMGWTDWMCLYFVET
jgi:tRNA-dihydrouridine synthase